MVSRQAESILCFGLVGLAALLMWFSFVSGGGINAASTDSPMRLPRILLGLWIILAAGCGIRAIFLPARSPDSSDDIPKHLGRAGLMVGVLFLVALSLPYLGYLFSVTVGLALLLLLLRETSPARFTFALLLLGPGFWALFHHILGLRLPLMVSGGMF